MLSPLEERLLQNIDELLDSNHLIEVDGRANFSISNHPKYKEAVKSGKIGSHPGLVVRDFLIRKYVVPYPCQKFDRNVKIGLPNFRDYYRLPQPFATVRNPMVAGPNTPFLNKFKYWMDWSFSVGLHQAWFIFFTIDYLIDDNNVRKLHGIKSEFPRDEKEILDINEIGPFFIILAIGYLIALTALLGEVFYHDFLSRLNLKYLKKNFRRCLRRKYLRKKKLNPRLNRRRSKVRPN